MKKSKLNVPTHIGIIMDGNGRWATRQNLERLAGHKEGVEACKRVVTAAAELGVKYLTLFAFSTENWKRSKAEVDGIFKLLKQHLDNADKYYDKDIKFTTIGDISKLPKQLQKKLCQVVEKTKEHKGLNVVLALNYGSKTEIINAINKIIKDKVKFVDDEVLKSYLETKDLPDPDLIIRTSGECRLSNFLLYQSAYSELYFPKTTWPEFDKKHLIQAIKIYNKRDRRYGAIK